MSMFKKGRCLGTGAYGAVYEAIRKSDQRKVNWLPSYRVYLSFPPFRQNRWTLLGGLTSVTASIFSLVRFCLIVSFVSVSLLVLSRDWHWLRTLMAVGFPIGCRVVFLKKSNWPGWFPIAQVALKVVKTTGIPAFREVRIWSTKHCDATKTGVLI